MSEKTGGFAALAGSMALALASAFGGEQALFAAPAATATPADTSVPARAASTPAKEEARDPARARELYQAALAAREKGDVAGYRSQLEAASGLLPDPSNLWFRLAGARVLAGDREGAFDALEAMILAGIHRDDFDTNADLAPLHEHLRWKPVAEAHEKLLSPLKHSTEAVRLEAGGQLVEGIAREPASGALFLSVVNQRLVLRRSPDGKLSTFVTLAGRLPGSPLGLAVDAVRKRLWAVTSGLPHGEGLPASEKGRGALAAFDLATGELVEKFVLDGDGHSPNDLVLAADGSVLFSDPDAKALWRRTAGGKLEELALTGALGSPGGLALSADDKLLYVADWSYGLAVVEIASREMRWLAPPAGSTVLGIDGLVRVGNSLIAIQNGVTPPRITRFELASDGRSLTGATLLERVLPEWDEPTLGTIVDGALFYVSNSHWPRFGEDGKVADPASLTPTVIRKLPLDSTP